MPGCNVTVANAFVLCLRPRNVLALTVIALIAGLFAAIIFGLLGLSFGLFQLFESQQPMGWAWRQWFAQPQWWSATVHSLGVALISTVISVVLSMTLLAGHMTVRPAGRKNQSSAFMPLLAPLLAVPHALMAMAMIILFSPTGWLMRVYASIIGVSQPPDYLFAPDPWGMTLVLVLVIKETAFLLLMAIATISSLDVRSHMTLGQSLGYQPLMAWRKVVLPILYPRLRLPILAVLVYAASVVELPLLTNSHQATTVSLLVVRAAQHSQLDQLLVAAAGAVYLLCLCLLLVGLWLGCELGVMRLLHCAVISGWRGTATTERLYRSAIHCIAFLFCILCLAAFAAMLIAALGWRWVFPDILPSIWYWHSPQGGGELWTLWQRSDVAMAMGLAFVTSGIAILGSLLLLEAAPTIRRVLVAWLYLPLIVPAMATVLGLQVLLFSLALQAGFFSVALGHLIFVLPYVYFSLSGGWDAWDKRYLYIAQTLGYGFWRARIFLCWPMLLRPILVAWALGMAVSLAQYLPTLLLSKGVINTPMLQFVQMSAGGNLRQISSVGLLLLFLIAVPFWFSTAYPAWRFRHRRGMLPERHA